MGVAHTVDAADCDGRRIGPTPQGGSSHRCPSLREVTERETDWPGVRLHVVTGKGGTGKTTVAASLALALASSGKQVLLCEVEGRQGIARIFDVPPLPYGERRIAQGDSDAGSGDAPGQVYALAIDPESALLEYLAMYYRLGRAGKALDRFGVIDFATTIAPGVRDVLLTGKVYEAAHRNRRGKNAREYDAVVLDAPPTGRIAQFLNVNSELAGLARAGPIRKQADNVMRMMRSERTKVHLVTLLEDMSVQETADAIDELRESGLPVGGVVVNLVRSRELDDDARDLALAGALPRAEIEADLERAGVEVTPRLVDGLLQQARDHAARRLVEDEQRARITKLDLPTYELPRLPDGIDLGALYELAAVLVDQDMA
jgi:anion-transporting  ArsA/GET3 family ATPase